MRIGSTATHPPLGRRSESIATSRGKELPITAEDALTKTLTVALPTSRHH